MRNGEEVQAALRGLVQRWQDFAGSEKAEAQTFLNELVDCHGLRLLDGRPQLAGARVVGLGARLNAEG